MSFYNDLKQSQPKKKRTCSEVIAAKYQQELKYLFDALKDRCRWASERGERRLYGYTYIENDRDYGENGIWLRWRSSIDYSNVPTFQEWIASMQRTWRQTDVERAEQDFDSVMPLLAKHTRDRLLQDLRRLLIQEGFPANCVRAVDIPVDLPVAFFFGEPVRFKRYGTYYGIEVNITW